MRYSIMHCFAFVLLLGQICVAAPLIVKTKIIRGGDPAQSIHVDVTDWQDLYLVVTYGGDSYDSDQAIWAEPTLVDKDGRHVPLTSAMIKKHQVGWGRLYVDQNHYKGALQIADSRFGRGFWAHGPSLLQVPLQGRYIAFKASVGLDRTAGKRGSAEFVVTSKPPKMPSRAKYTAMKPPAPKLPKPPSAELSKHSFNKQAAQTLLQQGIDKLIFVRRYTLNANHVYTEYVNSRWTPGGGLCVLDLKTGQAHDLVPEFDTGVFNRFDVSYDARKVVFDYRAADREGYRLFEIEINPHTGRRVPDTSVRQITFPEPDEADLIKRYGNRSYHHGTDDMHPCYLPDGGIAFVSTRCRTSTLCNSGDVFTTKVLFRMDDDGQNMQQISFNSVSEASPSMMPDGRLIYHRWEYNDKGAGAVKCLWAMRPDGTGSAEVYGNMITDPETMIYPRPIPGVQDKVVFLGTSHWGPNNAMGTVIVLDMNKDTRERDAMHFVTKDVDARAHDGFHFWIDGQWVHDKSGKQGRLFKDPYPLSEQLFLVAHKPKGPSWDDPKAYDLRVLNEQGQTNLLYQDHEISCWHPYPLQTRKRPPVPQTPLLAGLEEQALAQCIVTDIYEGLVGVPRGSIKYIRVLEQTPRPWTARNTWQGDRQALAHTTMGYGILGMKAQHGIVPVAEDGSANFYVPAGRNIYFQALDENYMAVETERTYVNYMPGEVRSCVGCHERSGQSPNYPGARRLLAMKKAPALPGPQPGEAVGAKLFDYERQIQPIWDHHCLRCHDGSVDTSAGLSLTGTLTDLYSRSYEELMGRTPNRKQAKMSAVGLQVDENSVRAYVEYSPPYTFGAYSSLLAQVFAPTPLGVQPDQLKERIDELREQHRDIKLSQAEYVRLVNWLDVSCQYYGSYWGKKNLQHRDSPYFRPEVTFEEAIGSEYPQSLLPLYGASR